MQKLRALTWRQPLSLLAAFAWVGVALDRFTEISQTMWVVMVLAAVAGLTICMRTLRLQQGVVRIILLCLVVLCLFGLRHHLGESEYHASPMLEILGEQTEPMIMLACVDRPARLQRDPLDAATEWSGDGLGGTEYQTMLQVSIETLRIGLEYVPYSGRALVRVGGDCSDRLPGDRVKLLGQISRIGEPTNPGQRDLRDWAARNDLHCILQVDRAEDVILQTDSGASTGYSIWRWGQRRIAALAASAREAILQQVSSDQQGLALALVLGQRDLLDNETSESLLVTGTAHLLSVSGLHLGILLVLARIVSGLMRLPLGGQWVFLVAVTVFYVAITGGRPPVLRAAILLAMVVLSTAMARPNHPLNSLSLAAILLAWWMPAEVFGVGMQLSFLAVATLLCCGRPGVRGQTAASQAVDLENQFDELARQSQGRLARGVRTTLSIVITALWYSGCVSVITLPIVWHEFHVVSPISVFVNVVLSPLMVVALSAGVTTVICGWLWLPLAALPGSVCSLVLSVMRWVIEFSSSIPGGHVWLPSPALSWIVTYYFIVLGILTFRDRGGRSKPIAVWSISWFVIAWWTATTPSPLPPGTLEATFVDVGHGTATIVRDREGEAWLYDCGWMGNLNQSSRKIDDVLWSMGITQLDGIVLSHADADHFNALPGLARRYSIGCIVVPPKMLEGRGEMLSQTRRVIQEYGIEVIEIDRDRSLSGAFDIEGEHAWLRHVRVLHPPSIRIEASDNANSLVLQLDHAGRYLLLPGDLEPPGTSVLISTPRPKPGGVMMAPHHGSMHMDADVVLQWARPRETIVSGGKRAAEPAVTEMLSAAGGGVHVTAKEGAIRVRINAGGEIEIRSWSQQPW